MKNNNKRDSHLPSPEVCDWLLSLEWEGPMDIVSTYDPTHYTPLALRAIQGEIHTKSFSMHKTTHHDACRATAALGADEIIYIELPVEALETLITDRNRRIASRVKPYTTNSG
jgi:hypothetical protein